MFEGEMFFVVVFFVKSVCIEPALFGIVRMWRIYFVFVNLVRGFFCFVVFFLKWVMIGNLQFWPMYQYYILEKIS